MTVYVDLLFMLNGLINYLLLRGSAVIGGMSARAARYVLGAVLGGAYAVAVVVFPGLQAPAYQFLCAAGMLVTTFGWKRNTVKLGLFFFALSFALSGAVLIMVQLAEPDCVLLGGRAYYALTVPALLLIAGLGYALAALVLAGHGTHTGGDLIAMTLKLRDREVVLCALRDTGNVLRDPVSGSPVLVADGRLLNSLLPDVDAGCLRDPAAALPELVERHPDIRFRLVPYHSVGVASGLLLAVRCRCRWKKHSEAVLTAFSPTDISSDQRYQAIWGGESV